MSAQEPWKISSEFLVMPVPADTPLLGSVPLLHLGKGDVAACRRASVCHGGYGAAGSPAPQWGPGQGMCVGADSAEPDGEGGAGLPSALLGSIPAFGTKAGAFPWPSAGAWKAVSCQHLLCRAAMMQVWAVSGCSGCCWKSSWGALPSTSQERQRMP